MSRQKSNVERLTEGASYIARAKKARKEQVEEIKFDDEARREFLTGFSKRKKAKTEDRRQRAKERDHQAHLDERRTARKELKERALENEKSVRTALGLEELDEGVSSGSDSDDDQPRAGPSTQEFSDDEQMATVTIEDDYTPTLPTLKRYNPDDSDSDAEAAPAGGEDQAMKPKTRVVPLMPASSKRAKDKAKSKAKKEDEKRGRSMETKAERKKGRALELTRRVGKAGRAMERDGKKRGVKGNRGGGKGGAGGKGGKRPDKKR